MKRMREPQRPQITYAVDLESLGLSYAYKIKLTSFPPISNEPGEAYSAILGTVSILTNRRRSILPIHPAFTRYFRVLSEITSLRFVTFFISAYSPILDVSGSLKLTPPRIK